MNALELKVPPPAVFLITAFAMWLTAHFAPTMAVALPGRTVLCAILIVAAGFFDLSGMLAFRKVSTTINPIKPDNTSTLVIRGIYRHTRNPMYVGLLLMLGAWAIYLSNSLTFLFLPIFTTYIYRFQILPEERVLSEKFGAEYEAYMRSVRRWI